MKSLAYSLSILLALAGLAIAGEGKSCDPSKEAHKAGEKARETSSCPMKDKKVSETKTVSLEGKLLCRKCNLKQTKSCEKVFQPAGSEALMAICPSSDVAAAEAVSEHGEAIIVIGGTMVEGEDGTRMIRIDSAKKKG